jgi:hypothetical protein
MRKSIPLLIAASTLFLAGCCTAHHAIIWEYRTVPDIGNVNELANQGWTLAGFTSQVNGSMRAELVYVMKHPKQ